MKKNFLLFAVLLTAAVILASCVPSEYKKGLDLSRGYPEDDMPLYDDAVVFAAEEDKDEIEISYGVKDGDVDDVADFYKDHFEDNGIILSKEKDEKDEYEAKGAYEDFEFKISIEEASGKYEEKVFETVVEVKIEFVKEDSKTAKESEDLDDGIDNSDSDDSYSLTGTGSVDNSDMSQVVTIKDANLEALVREQIGVPEGDITVEDMQMLYGLSLKYDEVPVYELDGLEYAYNMYFISYYGGSEHNAVLKSLAPLAKLPLLEYISVSYATVEEAPPLFETPVMDRASFIDLNLTDFGFLSGCTGMTQLTVASCGISSIEFVRGMNGIERLDIDRNKIKDISPVEGKTKLTSIDLQDNEITDIGALASCTSLESVIISYNFITTLSPLYDLPNLTEVRAYENIGEKKIDQGSIDNLVADGVEVYYHE